jgi:hypothetical protein
LIARLDREKGRKNMNTRKGSYATSLVLIALGILVLYGGIGWLLIEIPAAILLWYATLEMEFKKSRN